MNEQEMANLISDKFLEYSQRSELKELHLTDFAARFIFYASIFNIFGLSHVIPHLLGVAKNSEVVQTPISETVH